MSVCRYTGNMPISIRIKLLNRKCVPILVYGLCAGVCTQDKKRLSVINRNAYRFIFQVGLYSTVSEVQCFIAMYRHLICYMIKLIYFHVKRLFTNLMSV